MKRNPKTPSIQIMGIKITQRQIMYHSDYQTYDITFARGKRKATIRISVPSWGEYVGGHPEWGIVKAHEPLDKTQLLYAISQIVDAALGYIYLPAELLAEKRKDPRHEPHKKLFRIFKDVDELRKFDAELEERLYEAGFQPSLAVRERLAAEERAEYEREFAKRKREGQIYENPAKRHAITRIYNVYHRDSITGEDKFVKEIRALGDQEAIIQSVGRLPGWHWADANTYESPDGKECYWSWKAAKISYSHKPERMERKEILRNPLTIREYERRIDSAEAEIERARHFMEVDPHKAEEHAYTALGILEHLDKETPALISSEKKEIISRLRRIARIIIDRADYLQGKQVKRNPYRKNAIKSDSRKAISIRPISIGHNNDVAELLGLPAYPDVQEDWWEAISTMSYEAMQQADEEDIEEAGGEEEYRLQIEDELGSEIYGHYKSAIEAVFEEILGDVNATYKQIGNRYQIVPEKNWKDVAREIMEIINGVGVTYAGQDVEEFLEISAYTNYGDLVKAHLGWLKRRPDVYGGPSLERIYYSHMESVRL